MKDDKKNPTTKKGGELKGKDSTKADQGSGGSNDNTGFAQVMQLLATMMANQGNSRSSSPDPVIAATQRANAGLTIGVKDRAKTNAIDARRRKMNVSTQRGRTKDQKARDEESRSKTKRRNKDKKFARADRDLDRLDAQLKQDRIDLENLIAENKAAEAQAAADAQIEKNRARRAAESEQPPILPTPVAEDEGYGGGQGSAIVESPVPEQAPEPAAPAPAPAPAPAQAPPVQQELGPNPLQAVVYAHHPSMRPNPGPFSTDQRGGGPYAHELPPPTPYNPPGFENSGLGPEPVPPPVTHYGQVDPGTLPPRRSAMAMNVPVAVGTPHDAGYGVQNQAVYHPGSDARAEYIQGRYEDASEAQQKSRNIERLDDVAAMQAAPPAGPPRARTGGVTGRNYADFDDETARHGHDPSLTEANLRERMGYAPVGGVPVPQYGGVMDSMGNYFTGRGGTGPGMAIPGLTPQQAANPLAMMPVDAQGNRRPFSAADSNRGFFGPNPLQRLGHFLGGGNGQPIMVDPYSHGYTVGSYPR